MTNNCSSHDTTRHCTNTLAPDLSASRVSSDWDNKIGGGSGRGWAGQFSPPYGNTMFHIVAKLGLIGYTCATSPSVTFLLFRCRSGLEMTCQLTYNTYRGGGEEEGGVEEKKILIMRYLHSRSKLKIEMKINFKSINISPSTSFQQLENSIFSEGYFAKYFTGESSFCNCIFIFSFKQTCNITTM